MSKQKCSTCGAAIQTAARNYRYTESGMPNVVLQGIEVADCPKCGSSEVRIPRMTKIHRTIVQALAMSPYRLTGEQLRFIRTHLNLSGDQLALYLHTDKTKISKWERNVDRIGPAADRLIRLLAMSLESELKADIAAVAEHLPQISDDPRKQWELHVDVATLLTSFVAVSKKKAA